MDHSQLLEQMAVALGVGLAGGLGARRLGLSPIVGYIAAGILIGPFTPGYVGDIGTLNALADIGIIFLMFGVGLHFNLRDLLSLKGIVVPGALLQLGVVAGAGAFVGIFFDLDWREGLVLGLALSISSTVVAVRALEARAMLGSVDGRVLIGWLVVQDLATVLFLALLPALDSGSAERFAEIALRDLAKAGLFLGIVLFAGARIVPWMLAFVAKAGSRELFTLAVIAAALGIAALGAAIGLSVALGAFVGGLVLSERETSHQAAADVLPLREAFAVLFFVVIGMLVDPAVVRDHPGLVVAACVVAIPLKGLASAAIAAAFPYPARTAIFVGAGLAQAGEFSFIISREGLDQGLLAESTYDVVLAAAVVSIMLNPVIFGVVPRAEKSLRKLGGFWRWADRQGSVPATEEMRDHVVIAGYGRVGALLGHSLAQLGIPFTVIDLDLDLVLVRRLSGAGISAIWGDSSNANVLASAGVERSLLIAVCLPDESSSLVAVANARKLNSAAPIIVRARHADEISVLRSLGAGEVVVPEYEGGLELMRQALIALGYDSEEALHLSHAVRDIHYETGA